MTNGETFPDVSEMPSRRKEDINGYAVTTPIQPNRVYSYRDRSDKLTNEEIADILTKQYIGDMMIRQGRTSRLKSPRFTASISRSRMPRPTTKSGPIKKAGLGILPGVPLKTISGTALSDINIFTRDVWTRRGTTVCRLVTGVRAVGISVISSNATVICIP